jgi:hypothetical protein
MELESTLLAVAEWISTMRHVIRIARHSPSSMRDRLQSIFCPVDLTRTNSISITIKHIISKAIQFQWTLAVSQSVIHFIPATFTIGRRIFLGKNAVILQNSSVQCRVVWGDRLRPCFCHPRRVTKPLLSMEVPRHSLRPGDLRRRAKLSCRPRWFIRPPWTERRCLCRLLPSRREISGSHSDLRPR